jgi:hypothetical protein
VINEKEIKNKDFRIASLFMTFEIKVANLKKKKICNKGKQHKKDLFLDEKGKTRDERIRLGLGGQFL